MHFIWKNEGKGKQEGGREKKIENGILKPCNVGMMTTIFFY